MSVGLLQAQVLRDVARRHINDPLAFAQDYDAETERQVAPFYRNQITADRARIAEMNALEQGLPMPAPNPVTARFFAASAHDADVLRGAIEIAMCLALPQDVLARPRVAAAMAELDGQTLPPDPNIVGRDRMAALLNG